MTTTDLIGHAQALVVENRHVALVTTDVHRRLALDQPGLLRRRWGARVLLDLRVRRPALSQPQ